MVTLSTDLRKKEQKAKCDGCGTEVSERMPLQNFKLCRGCFFMANREWDAKQDLRGFFNQRFRRS
jgi:ribosomal protein S14